jgi:hypothetical protein
MWTLEYSGTEKSITDWGFTFPVLEFTSQDRTVFKVTVPGAVNLVAAPPIPFEAQVKVRRNRTGTGTGPWTGGEIVFVGRQVTRHSAAQPQEPLDVLTFADAWYDLENLVFQQHWQYGNPSATTYFSRLNLFQLYSQPTVITSMVNGVGIVTITLAAPMTLNNNDSVSVYAVPSVGLDNTAFPVTVIDSTHVTIPGQITGTYVSGAFLYANSQLQTNGQQIQEIINFANSAGVNIQPGVIDLNWDLPIYPVRGVSCASAIQICLKATPDAVHWIDYTTTPPSFNCRQRPALAALNLPFADGVRHVSSEIVPRFDLVASQVVLQYQRTDTIAGQPVNNFSVDAYPLLSTGLALRALVVPIDLRGAVASEISVQVSSVAIPTSVVGGQTVPTNTWWQQKKKSLGDSDIANLTYQAGSLTVIDDDGNNYSATWQSLFPNEHISGEMASWMKKTCKTVTIAANFTYDQKDAATRTISKIQAAKPHRIQVRVKLTDSGPGDVTYQTLESFASGETAPVGLAQKIYTSLQVLQHEGTHTIVDNNFDTTSIIPGPQYALNLTGGLTEWTTMLATIQHVSLDIFHHTCEVTFGPVKHLSPGDLEELLQFWRFRFVYDNLGLRISGQSSSGKPQLGGQSAKENTEHANPNEALKTHQADAGGGNSTFIQHDAPNGWIVLKIVDGSGNTVAGQSNIRIALGDAVSGSSVNKSLFIQEWAVCVPDGSGGFLTKNALFLSSVPY